MKGTAMQDNKITKELLESAKQFARLGLNAASTAVGYAAKVLNDVEKELKDSSEKITAKPAETTEAEQPKA
jgi:hypothetical protein